MDNRKGNIVLGIELSPDAQQKLVATLARIYKSYTPVQLTALVTKPKPLTLIKGVEETKARKFIESLQAQGVILQFVPSAPAAPTAAHPQVPAQAQTPVQAPAQAPPQAPQAQPVAPPQAPVAPQAPQQTPATPPAQQPPAQPQAPAADSYQPSAQSPPPAPQPPAAQPPAQPPGLGFGDAPPATPPASGAPPQAPGPDQGITMSAAPPPTAATPTPTATTPRKVTLKFTGTAGEYFRIWIVNTALTIVTLGIYSAWAKVRTRRYFYANTILDGQPFDYTAKPGTILKGHLIVGGALIAINILSKVAPIIGALVSAAAWSTVPFLLYKAHRFKARNSVYRNIRFRFLGDVMEAYKAYAYIPLFIILGLVIALPTLLAGPDATEPGTMVAVSGGIGGLAALILMGFFPYFMFLQRQYFHANFAYGKTSSVFRGASGRFYGIYLRAFFMSLALPFVGGIFFAIFGAALFKGGGEAPSTGFFVLFAVLYGGFLLLFTLVQQYVYASTFNYSWDNTKLGPISFDVSLSVKSLAWIRFTNVLAIVFSLGFMTPWAKVRRASYVLGQTTAVLPADMGAFQAVEGEKEGAVGDTAADFFDWDIGW